MSQLEPPTIPQPVEPVPYARAATPPDALMSGPVSRAILVGGILLRLIGAYTLVECRRPVAYLVDGGVREVGNLDANFGWMLLIVTAYVAWGMVLVLRAPRLLGSTMRRAAARSLPEGGEWSVIVLAASGAVVLLWTLNPLVGVFSNKAVFGDFLTALAQLALGVWLFAGAGGLSSNRSHAARPDRGVL